VSIGDFNYVNDPPDDDCGYDVPYYFRLTINSVPMLIE
jgi:hypothetical protein